MVRKKKCNDKKIIIGIIVVFLVLCFVGYKGLMLIKYSHAWSDKIKVEYEIIEIESRDVDTNADYEDMSILVPSEFEFNEEATKESGASWYYKDYVGTNDWDAWVTFDKSNYTLGYLVEEYELISNASKYGEILDKYDVDDNEEIIEYYSKHYDDNINIFTPVSKIKMDHMVNTYVDLTLPSFEKIYKLEGDLDGYLLKSASSKNFHIMLYEDEGYYAITFMNNKEDYFDYDKIIEILETVDFE